MTIKHRKLIILLGKNIAVSAYDAKTSVAQNSFYMLKAYSLNFFVFCHLNLHIIISKLKAIKNVSFYESTFCL